MRAFILFAALCAATPAAAQGYRGLALEHEAGRIADAQAARSRDITITNDLSTLQSRMQTDQNLSDLSVLRARPTVPTITPPPNALPPTIDISKLASIPDAELAASNARVVAAANNHR
jgi:hypothetical protein